MKWHHARRVITDQRIKEYADEGYILVTAGIDKKGVSYVDTNTFVNINIEPDNQTMEQIREGLKSSYRRQYCLWLSRINNSNLPKYVYFANSVNFSDIKEGTVYLVIYNPNEPSLGKGRKQLGFISSRVDEGNSIITLNTMMTRDIACLVELPYLPIQDALKPDE